MKQVNYLLTFLFLFSLTTLVNAQNKPMDERKLPQQPPKTSEEVFQFHMDKMQTELSKDKNIQVHHSRTLLLNYSAIDIYYIETWNGTMWENYYQIDFTYNPQGLLTDVLFQSWSSGWVNSGLYTYTYTGNGNVASQTYQTWSGSAWINRDRYSYSYNANSDVTIYLYETWSGGSWGNISQYLNTYLSNGNLDKQVYQIWSGGVWVNSSQYTYQYDANNNVTQQLTQGWSGGTWVNSYKYNYTYNSNGDYLTEVSYQWTGAAWQNSSQSIYTYNGSGLLTEYYSQYWDPVNGWINGNRQTYTYNGSGQVTIYLYQTWIGTQWVNNQRQTLSYNGSGQVIENLFETWNIGTGWENAGHTTIDYDANGNEKTYTYQNWDGTQWVNTSRYNYTWQEIISDVEEEGIVTNYSLENNYPNPFNPSTLIKFSVPQSSTVNIKIYDAIGKEVASLVNGTIEAGNHEVSFSGRNLSSGIYFYTMEAIPVNGEKSFVQTKKMILMK